MSNNEIIVSKKLQAIAQKVRKELKKATGEDIPFSLFVFTEGTAQYVSSTKDRAAIKAAILAILDGWKEGMPDIPAHERN